MTWLFVPLRPASQSAQASSAPSWECGLLSPDVALWVLSSGKPSPQPLSSLRWNEVPWIRLLYGTISKPSTAAHGAAAWISSLLASRASLRASPGNEPAPTTSAGSGPSSGRPPSTSERAGSSSRTSPVCFPSAAAKRSARSSATWPRAGGLRNGIAFLQVPSVPRTREIVSTCSLPTPSASEYGTSQNGINGKGGAKERPSAGTPSLTTRARSGELEIERLRRRGGQPTPTATDSKASGVAGNWTKASGRHAGATLTDVVARRLDTSTRSPSSQPTCEPDFETSSTPEAPPATGTPHLNPCFVEWMMGLPQGWTDTMPPRSSTSPGSAPCASTSTPKGSPSITPSDSMRSATPSSPSAQLSLGPSFSTASVAKPDR
jgi:hypothetical protein